MPDHPPLGTRALTPYHPRGQVEIIAVYYDKTFNIWIGTTRYLHDHHGYPALSHGDYPLEDLTPLPEPVPNGLIAASKAFQQHAAQVALSTAPDDLFADYIANFPLGYWSQEDVRFLQKVYFDTALAQQTQN